MQYMVIHLRNERYLEDILLAMAACGVTDAAVSDAVNMQFILATDMPIFAGFRVGLQERGTYMKIIAAPVTDEDTVRAIVDTLADNGVNFPSPELGGIYTFPVYVSFE
ncbi:MAG: hypothetical protein DRP79_08960 [Planctomycetota bacterium]|nr:MAG: hypothetical protein DRP79_08960 [Planctomycetota bacterium]